MVPVVFSLNSFVGVFNLTTLVFEYLLSVCPCGATDTFDFSCLNLSDSVLLNEVEAWKTQTKSLGLTDNDVRKYVLQQQVFRREKVMLQSNR